MLTSLLYKWKESHEQQDERRTLAEGEREELKRLRKVNKELRMEKEILKEGQRWNIASLLRERYQIKFAFIKTESVHYLVRDLCRVMQARRSAFYA